ncbi:MAG: DUF5615 family PIN-like protein [Ginsengibacter sp.]
MPEFIVDANLPFRIQKWQNNLFVHVVNINPLWDDDEIWDYAKTNNLIIITKDKDFRLKQIIKGFPPKLIHIKFGNLKLHEFENVINICWEQVEKLIKIHSLINIYPDTIEAIK